MPSYKDIEKRREYCRDYSNKYYEINKIEIEEKLKIPITCNCGSSIRKDNKAQHERSDKHQKFINLNPI